jgi:hypothetical protein
MLDGLARRLGVDPVEVDLGGEAPARRDQQERRRRDLRDEFLQRPAGDLPGEDARGRVQGRVEGRGLVEPVEVR